MVEETRPRKERKEGRWKERREDALAAEEARATGQPDEEMAQVEEFTGDLLRSWLDQKPPSNLSAAQLSGHLVKQIWKNGGELKEYLEWCLQPTEVRDKKVRNLFPLPLWFDDVLHLKQALEDEGEQKGAGRKRGQGETRAQMQRTQRLDGLKTWHGLIVVALNYHYGPGLDLTRGLHLEVAPLPPRRLR